LCTSALLNTIKYMMQADEEANAIQTHSYLLRHGQRLLSLSTILQGRCELGWTYQRSAYYQLIWQANKEKRLEWLMLTLTLRMSCAQMKRPYSLSVVRGSATFMQDNDLKHTLRVAKAFFEQNGVNWWRTPPESPNANPIESLWHELKVSEYHSEMFPKC